MKSKINTRYLLLGAIVVFIVVAATSNYNPGVSGSLTYAREKGTTCTDTDGGKDYYAPGKINGFGDWCESSKILVEYYCDTYGLVSTERYTCTGDYTCSYDKDRGAACTIGADVCIDSDDGRRPHTIGTVTVQGKDYEDYCYDHDTVVEFYCNPVNEVADAMQNCAYGCGEGACISR